MLKYKGSQELIVSKTYIGSFIGWLDEYIENQEKYANNLDYQIRISESYETRTHMFLIVESGSDHTDSDFKQSVLVLSREKYNTAKRNIAKRKN